MLHPVRIQPGLAANGGEAAELSSHIYDQAKKAFVSGYANDLAKKGLTLNFSTCFERENLYKFGSKHICIQKLEVVSKKNLF